jgi:hypothetical protein
VPDEAADFPSTRVVTAPFVETERRTASPAFVDEQHSEPRRLLLVRSNDLIGVVRDVCFGTLPAATSQPIGWRRRSLSNQALGGLLIGVIEPGRTVAVVGFDSGRFFAASGLPRFV